MTLADYMTRNRLTDDALAAALNVSRATVSRLRRGRMVPSFELAARIHAVTGRKVTPNDFLANLPTPSTERAA